MKSLIQCFVIACTWFQPLCAQNVLDNVGLSAGAPSSVAFSLRKLSTSYPGYAIKVRRANDNAEANVAFDGSNAVSALSPVTFAPGVALGTPLGITQAGIISCDVARTGTITIQLAKTGSITATTTSLTVTGISTSFTTELAAGDRLFNGLTGVLIGVVASVTNNTTLVLTNYSTSNVTTIAYKTAEAMVTGVGTNFTTGLAVGDRIFSTANSYVGTITRLISATSMALNSVNAVGASSISYKASTNTVTGTGTNFSTLTVGDLLISNNVTLGIISSILNPTVLTLSSKAGACISGSAFNVTAGTISFAAFYSLTSVYVNTWYDQSGNGRDAIQSRSINQPRIVTAGVPYTVNSKASVEFSGTLASFLQTSSVAAYLNNNPYTITKVTAEGTNNPSNQFPLTTTGGSGPTNTILHFGYRSSAWLTLAQLSHDHNFNSSATTSLEVHTAVKPTAVGSQMYRNGVSLGTASNGPASYLMNVGLLNVGHFIPTGVYYNGSISEILVFPSALSAVDIGTLSNSQISYYSIPVVSWTGAVSSDWNTPANWSTGVVPTISRPDVVLIPAGKPFYPIISSTTVPVSSLSIDAGASVTVTGTGKLQLGGTINNLGTCDFSSGTVEYVGTAPQGVGVGAYTGGVLNMTINNNSGVTLNGNITVSGNLTFTAGRLSVSTSTLTIGGTVTNAIAGGLKGDPSSSIIINGSVSPTLSFDQTTNGSSNVLKNLTINCAGQTALLVNDLVMHSSGTTTFTAGKLSLGTSTFTIRGAIVNTVNEGIRGSASSNLVVDGAISSTLSMDQSAPGTTNALNSLTINNSAQVATLNRSLTIISTLTITSGVFADGGNQVTSTGVLNVVSGTFKLGSATVATAWPSFATNNISTTGIAEYAAGVTQTVSGTPMYQNLKISAVGGTIAGGNVTVNNVLNLSAANPSATTGALNMSTYTLNMGSVATTIGQGDVTGIVKRTSILPNVTYTMGNEFSSITFPNTGTLPSQMSMKIRIGATPVWEGGAVKRVYDFIQSGGTGTKAVINAHYLDGELNGNIENKLVDFSNRFAGPVLTEHGKSNFNTTQNWIGLSNVNVAFFSSSFNNVELSFDETALTTLTWNGSTSTSWITATNWTPNGGPSTNTILIIPDAATTPNDPYLPATASNGSVTIETGGKVNSDPGARLELNNSGLDWSNSGTFNAGTSTIVFTNTNSTINGATDFYNVTINTGADLLMSSGTVMRIGGTLTNNGTWRPGLLSNTVEYNGNNQTVIIPNGAPSSYYNLQINGTGTTVLPAGVLSIEGNLTISNATSFFGNTVSMNGAGAQTINGSSPINFNNVTINNAAASVTLNQSITVKNLLTFTAGKLMLGSNTLTIEGNVSNGVSNGITGGVGSNMIINGTASPLLSFDQTVPGVTNALNNLAINSSGQVVLLSSDLEVNGTLTFTAGKLGINGHSLTLGAGVVNSVSGGLRGNASSSLLVGGGATSLSLSFDQTTPGTTNLLQNFSMNRAAQSVTLANSLKVAGALSMTEGYIVTTTTNGLTLAETASVSGGSDNSFINGPLVRFTNSTGSYDFPLGKSNTYRPVFVTPLSSVAGLYSAEYFQNAPVGGTYATGLTAVAVNEYWTVSPMTATDAEVGLIYNGASSWGAVNPTSSDIIFVAGYNSGTWSPVYGSTIPGNTGSGQEVLTSSSLLTTSQFALGYGHNFALPLNLLRFNAVQSDHDIVLTWITDNEHLLKGFSVQRSSDGSTYSEEGFVTATNTSSTHRYQFEDNHPFSGVNYYRLKMVDEDGRFRYSPIIKTDLAMGANISVYPNPVKGRTLMLQISGQSKGHYLLGLFDFNGRTVQTEKIMYDGRSTVQTIRLNGAVSTGMYYLQLLNEYGKGKTIKVFVQ